MITVIRFVLIGMIVIAALAPLHIISDRAAQSFEVVWLGLAIFTVQTSQRKRPR